MNSTQTTSSTNKSQVKVVRALTGAAAVVIVAVTLAAAWGALNRSGPGTPAAAGRDPLAQTATVQFRQSEHAEAPARVIDLLAAPSTIKFRQSEHSDAAAPARLDPLMAPSIVLFRQSEHTDAAR